MRADRLVATLLLLQRRPRVTAGDVADELEVSERTARRDLQALSMAGIPVYAQPGRGGGWSLVGGARTDLSGLTAAEARALFLVAGPAADATPELRAALRKLVRALPEPFRAGAETAAAAVVIDQDGWGETRYRSSPAHLDQLQTATVDGRQVDLGYRARTGATTTRRVHPLGLVRKATVWYLVAGTDRGLRTFRVDRVSSVTPTNEPVRRPDDFDIERVWDDIVATVDELRSPIRVDARVQPDLIRALRWTFDKQVEVGATGADGWVDVAVRGQHVGMVAARLAGFGAGVVVTGPEEARLELSRIGAELAAQYGRPS